MPPAKSSDPSRVAEFGVARVFAGGAYAVMEVVDTRYVKFWLDIGQLAKGGSYPIKMDRFWPVIPPKALEDYHGGNDYLGSRPLRKRDESGGHPDLTKGRETAGMVMVEMDESPNMQLKGLEISKIAKMYLKIQGCWFRV